MNTKSKYREWAVEIQDYRGTTIWIQPDLRKREAIDFMQNRMTDGHHDEYGLYHAPDKIFVRMGLSRRMMGQLDERDCLPIGAFTGEG